MAGLYPGDAIVAINGENVKYSPIDEVYEAIKNASKGSKRWGTVIYLLCVACKNQAEVYIHTVYRITWLMCCEEHWNFTHVGIDVIIMWNTEGGMFGWDVMFLMDHCILTNRVFSAGLPCKLCLLMEWRGWSVWGNQMKWRYVTPDLFHLRENFEL